MSSAFEKRVRQSEQRNVTAMEFQATSLQKCDHRKWGVPETTESTHMQRVFWQSITVYAGMVFEMHKPDKLLRMTRK